tara:strand:- start:163 stop:924 length:762 start_codon:yes stop_codon:yes gene_type:complete
MAINKINSLVLSSVAKVNSLAKSSMAKLNSLVNVTFSNTKSIDLDGVDDHMTANGAGNDISSSTGTMSIWVKLDSISANATPFKASVNSNNQVGFTYLNSSSKLRYVYKAGGTTKKVDHSVSIENDGNWHHIAITWDTSRDELKAYLDGSQVGSTQSSLGSWSGTISDVVIGKNSVANNAYWKGHLDQASVFTTVVAIGTLYNSGTTPDLTGTSYMVGWWQMEEGSGTSIADDSGTSNTGTLVNGTTFASDVA